MNLMLVGVTTRCFGRAVRLPEADLLAGAGPGISKSVASWRFVALSAKHLEAWLAADLSRLDLLAVQIAGIHLAEDVLNDLQLVAAVGINGAGRKHPVGLLVVGPTENAAVMQALLDELVKRGLDPSVPRLFLIDRAKALSTAIRRTFGRDPPVQRCQVHKARNILDRPPKPLHASTRRVLRQARERDDAERAETLLCTLARTLRREALGLAGRPWKGAMRSSCVDGPVDARGFWA
jgi:hypothetical protein